MNDNQEPHYCTFDGACEPTNPGGIMGLGWTIDGTEYYRKIEAHPDNTNNKAEYLALVALLRTLAKQLPPYMALSTRFGPF